MDVHDHQGGRGPDPRRRRRQGAALLGQEARRRQASRSSPTTGSPRARSRAMSPSTARQVGRLQGEALLKAMGDKANGGQIVMMNGDPTDPNAAWFKQGALSVLKGKVKIGKVVRHRRVAPGERPRQHVRRHRRPRRRPHRRRLAANDGLAAGVISALKAAEVRPLPPITGQDADLEAVQRIVKGEQYMTVYKPFKPEADAAAAMAVALGRGEKLDGIATRHGRQPHHRGHPGRPAHPGLRDRRQHQGHAGQGRHVHHRPDLHPQARGPPASKAGLTR